MLVSRLFLNVANPQLPAASAFAATSTQGFWNSEAEPVAAYYNGKTYFVWCDDSKHVWVASWNHSSQTSSTPVDLGVINIADDGAIHLTPCVLVRSSDHRIMVFASSNGGPSRPGYWLSTSPEDATAFGSVNLIPSGTGTYTYVSCAQLNNVTNSPIYLFTKFWSGGTGYLAYFKSSDGGSTWNASPTLLLGPQSTSTLFWRIGTDSGSRIDIYATTTDRAFATPAAVYHFLFQNDTLYQTDGTVLGTSFPYTANQGTLVQDTSLGSAHCDGWAYQADLKPASLIMINTGSDTLARVARWTGSAWQVNSVIAQGGFIGSNPFVASGAMSKASPNVVWLPVKVGSFFELRRYNSANDGASWLMNSVTSGSTADNAMPDTPLDAAPGFEVIWGNGTYTSDSNFDFDIKGGRA